MIGLQIVVDIVLAYLLIRLWMERRRDAFRVTTFDRESREAMETYRDELEDLLDRLESRIAEERKAVEAMTHCVGGGRTTFSSDLRAEEQVIIPAGSPVGVSSKETEKPETRVRDKEAVRERIWELDREGLSTKEIARKTGSGTREVDLVLAMGKHQE